VRPARSVQEAVYEAALRVDASVRADMLCNVVVAGAVARARTPPGRAARRD
jgi:hypothetical protein